MLDTIRRLLVAPRLPGWVALLAVLTAAPALFVGWLGDDWVHRAVLGHHPPFVDVDPIQHLFRFLGPGRINENLASAGLLSWWADMDVRASFFRPLSALTHLLDHTLWPDSAVLQHAHSLLWAGLMTWCAARLAREEASTPLAAGLAAVVFAVEDAHAIPVSWLANRNALLTTTFSILAVHAYARWRHTGDRRLWAASLLALTAGLFSGEAALGACAWMGARALTRERSWLRGLGSLVGPAVVVVAWRLLYDHLGYGADRSGLYIDPGATPLVWLSALVQRWPVLAGGQLLSAPIDGWGVLPTSGRAAMTLAGLLVTALFAGLAWPTLRARPTARTAALAFLLILVPSTATFPMDRLLALASLPAALLFAEVIDHHKVLERAPSAGAGRSPRWWVLAAVLAWYVPVAALARPVRCAGTPLMGLIFEWAELTGPRDPKLEHQTLVFVQANEFAAMYTYVKRSVPPHNEGRPEGVALLSTWWTDVKVTREDDDTLVIEPDGGFLARPIDHLIRDPHRNPFRAGDQIHHHGMEVEVRRVTPDGRPAEVAFHFPDILEDTSQRRFVTLDMEGTHAWNPPEVGASVMLPGLF